MGPEDQLKLSSGNFTKPIIKMIPINFPIHEN